MPLLAHGAASGDELGATHERENVAEYVIGKKEERGVHESGHDRIVAGEGCSKKRDTLGRNGL